MLRDVKYVETSQGEFRRLPDMRFIERTIKGEVRKDSITKNTASLPLTFPYEAAHTARVHEAQADYLAAALYWRNAADHFPESQQYRRRPYIEKAERCENLYRQFYALCKLSDKELGFGKRMGQALYVHFHYADRAIPRSVIEPAKKRMREATDCAGLYNVVKWDRSNGCVSFLKYHNFNTTDEPLLMESYTVPHNKDQKVRTINHNGGLILHHKWLLVRYDFAYFDMAEAIKRSLAWRMLPGIDSKRIGRREYWESEVVPRIVPIR